ncbi:MAG: mechanosensitive ion channel family protein [Candidatus Bathyarchaeota archaeon]|nr:MAG: mechanosensitive ion channel family protein [Candidatus Bathyarchaeota archaeon]
MTKRRFKYSFSHYFEEHTLFTEILTQVNLIMVLTVFIILLAAYVLYRIIVRILRTAKTKLDIPQEKVEALISFVKVLLLTIAFIAVLATLNIDVTGLVAGVSIGALAVGFAAQTLISNLISGLFLIFEKVFTIGDLIQFEDITGKVLKINFRTTQIQTVDGNIVTIPNSTLATSQIINLTSGTNQMLLTIIETIDMYANLETAKQLMIEAITETDGVILNAYDPTIVVDRDPQQWSILLTLYVMIQAEQWHLIQSTIKETIKRKFDQAGIIPPIPAIARYRLDDIQKEIAAQVNHNLSPQEKN